MHIPDNYLSPQTCAVMTAAAIPVLIISVRKIKKQIPKERIPLIGIGAAFSFLLMMFNIPLPGGTTGHAVGSALISFILGPYAACIATSIALLIQAVIFGDGGILSFGANCFNMAVVMPFISYTIYSFIKKYTKSKAIINAGIAVSSYIAINTAALCAAIEFGIQPILFKSASGQPLYCPYPLSISVPAMVIPHLLTAGIIEGAFSLAIFTFIQKFSPHLIYDNEKPEKKPILLLIGALILLTPLGLIATGTAWGEWGYDEIPGLIQNGSSMGFIPEGMKNGFSFNAPIPDYSLSGTNEIAGYILSAIIGAALLIIIFKMAGVLKGKSANG